MSAGSQNPENDNVLRTLRTEEILLLLEFVKCSPAKDRLIKRLESVPVTDMNDGGMGSIRFQYPDSSKRCFGFELATAKYRDRDGVPVSIAFNLDQYGEPFELDFWKADFSPLLAYPNVEDVKISPNARG